MSLLPAKNSSISDSPGEHGVQNDAERSLVGVGDAVTREGERPASGTASDRSTKQKRHKKKSMPEYIMVKFKKSETEPS